MKLWVMGLVELAYKRRETLHEVNKSVQAEDATLLRGVRRLAVFWGELGQITRVQVLKPFLDWWEEHDERHDKHLVH